MTPNFKPGDQVLYVPDPCHQLDSDAARQPLFHFEHLASLPGNRQRAPVRKGDPVDFSQAVKITGRNEAGQYLCEGGQVIRAVKPRVFWAGTVAAFGPAADKVSGKPVPVAMDAAGNVVPDDEGRIFIDVPHPLGTHTLHYAVRYSTARAVHTFHRQGD